MLAAQCLTGFGNFRPEVNWRCIVLAQLRLHLPSLAMVVGCFKFNEFGLAFETVFQSRSISGRLPETEKEERNDKEKKSKHPTRTYCKRSRPLSYYYANK